MKFWNTTKETVKFMYDQRPIIMAPDSKLLCQSVEMKTNIMRDMSYMGIVFIDGDSDMEAKRKEGLLAVHQFEMQQLKDWVSFLDENRSNGKTVLGLPRRMQVLQRNIAAREEELGLDPELSEEIYDRLKNEKLAKMPIVPKNTGKKRGPKSRVNIGSIEATSPV